MQNNRIYRLILVILAISISSYAQLTKEQYEEHLRSKIEKVHIDYKPSTYLFKASNDMLLSVICPIIGIGIGGALLYSNPTEPTAGLFIMGSGVGLGVYFQIKTSINFRKASKALKDANL